MYNIFKRMYLNKGKNPQNYNRFYFFVGSFPIFSTLTVIIIVYIFFSILRFLFNIISLNSFNILKYNFHLINFIGFQHCELIIFLTLTPLLHMKVFGIIAWIFHFLNYICFFPPLNDFLEIEF